MNWYRYVFKYHARRKREAFAIWIVAHLPRWVIYRAVIRAAVKDEQGHPGEVTALTMLKRFEG